MSRMIFHNPVNRISIGVDIDSAGAVTASITRCNTREEFNRKQANKVLNGRLDKFIETDGRKASDFAHSVGLINAGMTNGDVFRFARDMARVIRRNDEFESVKESFFDEIMDFISYDPRSIPCAEMVTT